MARGWRVLDATSFDGTVGGRRGRITFTPRSGECRDEPAEDLAVVLVGTKAQLDVTALHYAAKHDIALLAVDWRGVPFGGFYPWSVHGRVGARHLAQSQLPRPRRKNAWMQVTKAKITGQAWTLHSAGLKGWERLETMAKEVRSGDPGNLEGTAARWYWSHLFDRSSGFTRDPSGGDCVNAQLNYGYTVLRGYAIRAVLGAGLSPPLGIFHRGRSNYFNLADDLIEPFRPSIDAAVFKLGVSASTDDPNVKHAIAAAATQAFDADGTRIPAVLDDLAQQFGRYVEGQVPHFAVPYWTGPKAESHAQE